MRRFVILMLACAMLAGTLAACGRKGEPEQPPGDGPGYPRHYPSR